MITQQIFETCVQRAGLAPTVHNTQPARWQRDEDVLSLYCDTTICLPVYDPAGAAAALSCGAVLEAMVLALSAFGIRAKINLTGKGTAPHQGLVPVAHLTLSEGAEDGLHRQLEHRFTWRGAFDDVPVDLFGWIRPDARIVLDHASRTWLADYNDAASFDVLKTAAFRNELTHWMRFGDGHPRAGLDGMDRSALLMSKGQARMASLMLKHGWGVLTGMGATKRLTAERDLTLTAPLIALFHRDIHEDAVTSGRAYLRLWLEAASLGFGGWPMAALSDDTETRRAVETHFGIPSDRRLVQVIRFGRPLGEAPPRARRPLAEVLI